MMPIIRTGSFLGFSRNSFLQATWIYILHATWINIYQFRWVLWTSKENKFKSSLWFVFSPTKQLQKTGHLAIWVLTILGVHFSRCILNEYYSLFVSQNPLHHSQLWKQWKLKKTCPSESWHKEAFTLPETRGRGVWSLFNTKFSTWFGTALLAQIFLINVFQCFPLFSSLFFLTCLHQCNVLKETKHVQQSSYFSISHNRKIYSR